MKHQAEIMSEAAVYLVVTIGFMYLNFPKAVQDSTEGISLGGDARFDSPGFSAKYCTYYMQVGLTTNYVDYLRAMHLLYKI